MEFRDALIDASKEVLSQFGMTTVCLEESEQELLASARPINILIGLTSGIRGNVVLGIKRAAAMKIISAMMGGSEIMTLDAIGKSALAEFANMIMGCAIGNLRSAGKIDYTPPTLVTGQLLFLIISRVKSYILTFQLNNLDVYDISFSIE